MLRWNWERSRQSLAPTPPRGSFPTAQPVIASPRAAEDVFTATWIGHATVLLQVGGLNILTDPFFSERASPVPWAGPRRIMSPGVRLEALPPIDAVLLSHNHYDHFDAPAVKLLARLHRDATWIVPLELGASVRRHGATRVVELDWWQQVEVNGLRVTATPARHFAARSPRDRNRTLWCGFALEVRGQRAYFAGDTAYHPDFGHVGAQGGPFDLVMIPIGAYEPRWFMRVVHVNPEEAVRVYQDITSPHGNAPLMLALHWGTIRLTDEPMDEPPRRAREQWRALGLPDERLWIARFGETRVVQPAASARGRRAGSR
ncbi:MAG TPA: MBL fold metallo-hydrolase [Gemmatimonadaceae bacterium]